MAVPAPFILEPSTSWNGNDGNWSTFNISIGTPPQYFEVLASTTSSQVWVPVPDGCAGLSWSGYDCGTSRGVDSLASGFLWNDSSTWHQLGLYQLPDEQNLFGSGNNGSYGIDVITLSGFSLRNTTAIAGIATRDFWLGNLGLGGNASTSAVYQQDLPGIVSALKLNKTSPSKSYGYTAGAAYNDTPASLTFGGFDDARLSGGISIPLGETQNSSVALTVFAQSLVVSNSLQGAVAFPQDTANLSFVVDSTTSQLWLPQSICDRFEEIFGLFYDNTTDLYLVNSTMHDQLVDLAPEFTFTLAADGTTSTTTNIVLPYSAFDLEIGVPFYNSSTVINYFPIRRASNVGQYVLGRAFLQEAYLVVDYERGNFTVGQTVHTTEKNIVAILPPSSRGNSPSGGAIAGIVVGIIVAIAVLLIAAWLIWRRRVSRKKAANKDVAELADDQQRVNEMMSGDIHQLPSEEAKHQLMSRDVHELHQESVKYQLMSNDLHELPHAEVAHQLMSTEVHELPGSAVEKKEPTERE